MAKGLLEGGCSSHPAGDSLRSARAGKGSPNLPKSSEGARIATGLLDSGRTSCSAGDSLRSPGRTTESRVRPRLRTAHPKGTGKWLVFCAFFPPRETNLKPVGFSGRRLCGSEARWPTFAKPEQPRVASVAMCESNRTAIG